MSKNLKIIIFIVLFIWFVLVSMVVIWYSTQSIAKKDNNTKPQAVDPLVQEDRMLKISFETGKEVGEGFWYEHTLPGGGTHMAYFDPLDPRYALLSKEEFALLIEKLQASRIFKTQVSQVSEEHLPETSQIFNSIVSSPDSGNYLEIKQEMENREDVNAKHMLSYMYSLEGDYDKSERIRQEYCANNPGDKEVCVPHTLTITGRVENTKGEGQSGAWVHIISSRNNEDIKTDSNGYFTLDYQAYPHERIRVESGKRNFSSGVSAFSNLGTKSRTHSLVSPIVISAPLDVYTIDPQRESITGVNNSTTGSSYRINTDRSSYTIPKDAIVDQDGNQYTGLIDVYVYEFDRDNVPEGLTEVDTFDQVMGYAGDLMKTFGMPYIQFFAQDTNDELHVFSDNPMELRTTIHHIDYLYEARDGHHRKLTNEDMKFLVNATNTSDKEYPIDREFIIDNQLLAFPPFWVFDQNRGVWDNVGIRVVEDSGVIETPFYTTLR